LADELIQDLAGVIDLHIHGYPEISLKVPNAAMDQDWLAEAQKAGMRAVCLKSHYWPTTDKAFILGRLFPGIAVFGGIVLNATSGGFSPLSVRVAVANGAKVVWFPTWSAANDVAKNGYSRRVAAMFGNITSPPLSVLDPHGRLLPEVEEILTLIAAKDLILATGHLSVQESKILIDAAGKRGVKKIILTHALTAMIDASIEDQQAIAAMGAFIEHSFIATLPMHQQLPVKKIVESIRAVGAEHCLLTTDAVFAWNPAPPQMMRMYIQTLLAAGLTPAEIEMMVKTNPAVLLGL
jgi:hypothetical protein